MFKIVDAKLNSAEKQHTRTHVYNQEHLLYMASNFMISEKLQQIRKYFLGKIQQQNMFKDLAYGVATFVEPFPTLKDKKSERSFNESKIYAYNYN